MKYTKLIKSRNSRCNVLKFSPCGKFLAVAISDHIIEVFATQNQNKISTFKGHKDQITHFDWSKNSEIISSNSVDGELLYFIIREGILIKPEDVRNEEWASFSRMYGWHDQGAWNSGFVTNSQRNNFKNREIIAVSDDSNGLKIYK